MAFSLSTKKLYFTMLLLFIFVVTISMVTTSQISRVIVEQARSASILGLGLGLVLSIFLTKISYKNVFSLTVIISFFSFGYLLSLIYGGLINSTVTVTTMLIIFMGNYLLYSSEIEVFQYKFARWFIIYAIIVLIITIITKGLIFTPIPVFIFEYSSNAYDINALYSQGTSQFYGYSALAAASLIVTQDNKTKKNILTILVLLFILLSFLGGARGDSVFALIVTSFYLVYRLSLVQNIKILIFLLVTIYVLSKFYSFEDFIIFQRLEVLSDGLGSRDVLLSQSIMLLVDNTSCLIHGCGFGFFQSYFHYPIDLYPHNFIIELLIVFGLPITAILLLTSYGGFMEFFRRNGRVDIIGLFFIYALFLGLKSGSLNTSWLLMTFFIFFISYYMSSNWSKIVNFNTR
ncbi:hypothetical protein [Psychrobacter sp. CMS30]|uniref:hypothetical protein n=1 Tax=Psychrobacter sp. CMS30 TaxID=2774126 RepID=UPI00191948A5|nr:hypothetical protein [Psychrobacter sp. CMS30]